MKVKCKALKMDLCPPYEWNENFDRAFFKLTLLFLSSGSIQHLQTLRTVGMLPNRCQSCLESEDAVPASPFPCAHLCFGNSWLLVTLSLVRWQAVHSAVRKGSRFLLAPVSPSCTERPLLQRGTHAFVLCDPDICALIRAVEGNDSLHGLTLYEGQ